MQPEEPVVAGCGAAKAAPFDPPDVRDGVAVVLVLVQVERARREHAPAIAHWGRGGA